MLTPFLKAIEYPFTPRLSRQLRSALNAFGKLTVNDLSRLITNCYNFAALFEQRELGRFAFGIVRLAYVR
jgi:hypothetical protein